MISTGCGFVVRHKSGRYFNSDGFAPAFKAGELPRPYVTIYRLVYDPLYADLVYRRDGAARWIERDGWIVEDWTVEPGPGCSCCGERWGEMRSYWNEHHRIYRCPKHQARNPCVIEGCTRTRAAHSRRRDDISICGEHWRRYVPPGSAGRRALNRLARLAKKAGFKRTDKWPDELEARYWRLWTGILRHARRQSLAGDFDMTEINKLFGWSDGEEEEKHGH